jgi:hypothetical protein
MSKESAMLQSKGIGACVDILDLCFYEKERSSDSIRMSPNGALGALNQYGLPIVSSGSTPGAP